MKNMSNLDSVSIDSDMAKVFEQTNKVLEKTQDQAEKNMDIIQDAAAID